MTRRLADSDARTIFLVDGWISFRRSLQLFLEAAGYGVVGGAATIDRAAQVKDFQTVDVVILEPSLQWPDLHRDLNTIQRLTPAAGIVLLSSEGIPTQVVFRAFQAGASAYLTKRDGPAELRRAIQAALSNDFVMLPRRLVQRATVRNDELTLLERAAEARRLQLTRREFDILTLAGESFSNREIGHIMWVDEQTVKFHLSSVFRKLDVSNRAEAVAAARRLGLLDWGMDELLESG